ncbi:hypothetical protein T492DRAFT_861269 [Pavlovales sp. CCMP2436]|nr:hypothetical protein T492DRAFT_861269 [Pavlovales sp. CCMP2436]
MRALCVAATTGARLPADAKPDVTSLLAQPAATRVLASADAARPQACPGAAGRAALADHFDAVLLDRASEAGAPPLLPPGVGGRARALCAALSWATVLASVLHAWRAARAPAEEGASDRLRGLGFARYLASLHVALGHASRRQSSGLAATKYFVSFGFTWVPWFFMLSGFVLGFAKFGAMEMAALDLGRVASTDDDDNTQLLADPEIASARPPPRRRLSGAGLCGRAKLGLEVRTALASAHEGGSYAMRRLGTLWPLYACGFVLGAWTAPCGSVLAASWRMRLAQASLLQVWWPFFQERGLQQHCWFVACMPFLWLLLPSLARWAHSPRGSGSSYALVLLLLLPFAALFALPLAIGVPVRSWAGGRVPGVVRSATDVFVVLLKFSPPPYVPQFVLGVLLARKVRSWRAASGARGGKGAGVGEGVCSAPFVARFGATIGYSILAAIFGLRALRPPVAQPSP